MISFNEAKEELQTLPWPEGVVYYLSPTMQKLVISKPSLKSLDMLGLVFFEECVNKAMIYLRAANPSVTLAVVDD